MNSFGNELRELINRYSMENESNTPDFILSTYMLRCLVNFETAIKERENWYGRKPETHGLAMENPE